MLNSTVKSAVVRKPKSPNFGISSGGKQVYVSAEGPFCTLYCVKCDWDYRRAAVCGFDAGGNK